jgi:DNA-binding NarL/FixJ family response regulator
VEDLTDALPQDAPALLILSDSIEPDQGRRLIRRLRRRRSDLQILLLVQDDHWLTLETLSACRCGGGRPFSIPACGRSWISRPAAGSRDASIRP